MFAVLKKNSDLIFTTSIYFVIFLFLVFPYSDKDWGWHYQYGLFFIKNFRILTKNTFSWSLPNYIWVNHSWAFDPILYILFKFFGYVGLSLVGAFCYFISFVIITRQFKLSNSKIGILGIFFVRLTEPGIFEGLRSQDIVMPLFALVIVLLIRAKEKPKLLFFLPPIFLLWANLHASFPLGLIVVGVFLGCYFLTSRKNLGIYAIVMTLAVAVTFINPFGYKVYLEAFSRLNNPYIKNVFEWDPIYQDCSYCHLYTFIPYVFVLGGLFVVRRKKEDLPYLVLFLAFLYSSIDTRRNLPLYALITLPYLSMALSDIKYELEQHRATIFITALCVIVGIEFNLFSRFTNFNLYHYSENDYCRYSGNCSPAMAKYLIAHYLKGKGFNFYDWGGYYIGKGVPEKMFIDGRMHVWSDNGYMPFADYVAMYYDKDNKKFIDFKFDWVLVPLSSYIGQKIYNTDDIGKWKIEFQDKDSILYTRR